VTVEPGESSPGESSVFASALHAAVMNGDVDLAVQGLQEAGGEVPAGLKLAAVTQRIDCRDAAVTAQQLPLVAMPEATQVVVDGPRRAYQVKRLRADLEPIVLAMRPDVLLRSVGAGEDQAGIVGLGDLRWMGAEASAADIYPTGDMMPAPGQGALGLVIRDGDAALEKVALTVHHKATWACFCAERALFARFGWNSYAPAGALAEIKDGKLRLQVAAFGPDGGKVARVEAEGEAERSEEIANEAAEKLKAQGAEEFVREAMRTPPL
jgi:hydroxymethylbilane synthase